MAAADLRIQGAALRDMIRSMERTRAQSASIASLGERDDVSELAPLCRRCNVARLDLFGSAATAAFDPATSDLDFLVVFAPMPPVAYADAYFRLREGLERLFDREIDLVTEASLANPYFRRRVNSERRVLFPTS